MSERPPQIEKKLPQGAILQKQRFGRKNAVAFWLETARIQESALILRNDPDLRMDWVENISFAQMDDAFLATYFLRSRETGETMIFRSTVAVRGAGAGVPVEFPSVRRIWETAEPFEKDIAELFGIQFTDPDGNAVPSEGPGNFSKIAEGFPLRKEFRK